MRATARERSDDEKIDDWSRWWDEGLPLDEINSYLDAWHDRFNLCLLYTSDAADE